MLNLCARWDKELQYFSTNSTRAQKWTGTNIPTPPPPSTVTEGGTERRDG